MGIRAQFVERFSEAQAAALEAAAKEHANGTNSANLGTDPFKWTILICIGYQCVEVDRFRTYHGVTIPFEDFKSWCKDSADLASHDGDFDYLGMLAGAYAPFMPDEISA